MHAGDGSEARSAPAGPAHAAWPCMHQAVSSGASGAVHDRAVVGIEKLQIGRGNARKMPPFAVHQELAPVGGNGQAEMIAHRLVPVEMHREPESRRQIDTQLPFAGVMVAGSRGPA